MKVLGKDKVVACMQKHADTRKPLEAWLAEAEGAAWTKPQDIKDRYGSADFLSDNRVVINIKGKKYRLVLRVAYAPQLIVVSFAGTHAEYDELNLS